jgi:hypothetical protein
MSVQSNDKKKAGDSGKLKVIEEIVRDKQICFGYAPLNDAAAREQAKVWLGHLADVPTRRLRDVYNLAMGDYESKIPFSPANMNQAWRRLRERESERARLNPPCKYCDDTGRMKYNHFIRGPGDIECPNH